MAEFVHITEARWARRIQRSGIAARHLRRTIRVSCARLGRTRVFGTQAMRQACHTDGRVVDVAVMGWTFSVRHS
ncbi:hypothetical protein [Micromonospora sp. DT47]|uniref:hypothetical protein n=1 Tax=Micromonospora sp. DT47 TaxID=3393431 RepID=UPI003CF6A4F5